MNRTTHFPTPEEIEKNHNWYVIDAENRTLGRIASLAAHVLRGKNKPTFTPHLATGDHVIIVNAAKLRVSGKKLDDKIYFRHTEFPGGIKTDSLRQLLEKKPERVLEIAVKGMLPKNSMGHKLMTRLMVYAGPSHPHTAQNPKSLTAPGLK
jgi:large subunit ribosomal protein L13